jgi:hypothetical protein
LKLPSQPNQYNQSFEQQRSGILERAVNTAVSPQSLSLLDGVAAPGATPGKATLYVDTADGDLKVVFADGTIKTIATNP